MLLASCNHVSLAELPAPLQVDQPTVCEEVLAHVEVPIHTADDDAISAYLEMTEVAINASERVDLGRECIRDQRLDYAGKGKPK
jgi:hypothetical protein